MWRTAVLWVVLVSFSGAVRAQAPPIFPSTAKAPVGSSRLPSAPETGPAAPAAGIAKPGAPAESPAAPPETLRTFDYRRAEVEWADDRWRLTAGGVVLKEFGRNEAEARQALALLRELRLTQLGTVGTPLPIMEYWLADGHAPQGLVAGLHTIPMDPRTLKAEQLQGQWWVRDAHRVLFNFGGHVDEARQAVGVLQHYGFTQIGFVGQPSPLMIVLLGGPAGSALNSAGSAALGPSGGLRQASRDASESRISSAKDLNGRRAAETGSPAGSTPAAVALPFARQLSQPASRPPDIRGSVERLALDWRQVHLQQDRGGCRLVMGGATLADFGPGYDEARFAERAVRFYRFTEECHIGGPHPVFRYFLVNGQAPHGTLAGTEVIPFQPDALAVRRLGDGWAVCDGEQPLFRFGPREEEARDALSAIQHYRFDALCQIGHSNPAGLAFPVRTH
jgi:hypothetical protein